MLSFLIPTYNYDCRLLVKSLHAQATALKSAHPGLFDFEILVADDASPDRRYLHDYADLAKWEGCQFLPLKQNLGRAKIRNFLARQAKFDHIIFIDCDAEVCTPDFVARYWQSRNLGDVVCGSLRNPVSCPPHSQLRYRYEKAAERQRTVAFRSAQPYAYFTTFNVLFHRSVFTELQFDERCTEYGYEDALMGVTLQLKGYQVAHIDNPLIHNGIDRSVDFLAKIETSLRVLHRLGEPLHSASALVLLKRKLSTLRLLPVVAFFYRHFKGLLIRHLTSDHPSMFLLKFYKLGYYVEYERNAKPADA